MKRDEGENNDMKKTLKMFSHITTEEEMIKAQEESKVINMGLNTRLVEIVKEDGYANLVIGGLVVPISDDELSMLADETSGAMGYKEQALKRETQRYDDMWEGREELQRQYQAELEEYKLRLKVIDQRIKNQYDHIKRLKESLNDL